MKKNRLGKFFRFKQKKRPRFHLNRTQLTGIIGLLILLLGGFFVYRENSIKADSTETRLPANKLTASEKKIITQKIKEETAKQLEKAREDFMVDRTFWGESYLFTMNDSFRAAYDNSSVMNLGYNGLQRKDLDVIPKKYRADNKGPFFIKRFWEQSRIDVLYDQFWPDLAKNNGVKKSTSSGSLKVNGATSKLISNIRLNTFMYDSSGTEPIKTSPSRIYQPSKEEIQNGAKMDFTPEEIKRLTKVWQDYDLEAISKQLPKMNNSIECGLLPWSDNFLDDWFVIEGAISIGNGLLKLSKFTNVVIEQDAKLGGDLSIAVARKDAQALGELVKNNPALGRRIAAVIKLGEKGALDIGSDETFQISSKVKIKLYKYQGKLYAQRIEDGVAAATSDVLPNSAKATAAASPSTKTSILDKIIPQKKTAKATSSWDYPDGTLVSSGESQQEQILRSGGGRLYSDVILTRTVSSSLDNMRVNFTTMFEHSSKFTGNLAKQKAAAEDLLSTLKRLNEDPFLGKYYTKTNCQKILDETHVVTKNLCHGNAGECDFITGEIRVNENLNYKSGFNSTFAHESIHHLDSTDISYHGDFFSNAKQISLWEEGITELITRKAAGRSLLSRYGVYQKEYQVAEELLNAFQRKFGVDEGYRRFLKMHFTDGIETMDMTLGKPDLHEDIFNLMNKGNYSKAKSTLKQLYPKK